ncbi:type II toxin-antitoxin system CcdA family antitoxin [Marivita sp.]|uniref:type II toxin-antitoxin system CcdA family antitoxin n=1 Tax=Marivita sp. TaxID=2003365 RepID=UPI003F6C7B25
MPRKSTSLSLDADLIARAKNAGVNLSRAAEAGIEDEVRKTEAARWAEENREAIEAYNRRIEQDGLPLDAYRKW